MGEGMRTELWDVNILSNVGPALQSSIFDCSCCLFVQFRLLSEATGPWYEIIQACYLSVCCV